MAVELAQHIYDQAKSELLKRFGATSEDLQALRDRLTQLEGGNMDEYQKIAGRLVRFTAFRDMVLASANPFEEAIKTFFPRDEIEHSQEIEQSRNQTKPVESYPRARKPEKYVDGAAPLYISALIAQDNGEFTHQSLEEVGLLGLKPAHQNHRPSIEDARLYVYQEAVDTARGLLSEAGKHKARTISELFTPKFLQNFKNLQWSAVYKEMAEQYGDLPPATFVQTVLLRFHPAEAIEKIIPARRITKEKGKKKEKGPRHLEHLKPGDITPLDELMLDNRLVRPDTLVRLSKIFNDQDPLLLATSHGFSCEDGSLADCLQRTREEMAEVRQSIPPTNSEGQEATKAVKKAIRLMSKDKIGWRRLSKIYRGFKFMYALTSEVGNDDPKIDEVIHAIFPNIIFEADGAESFLLKGMKL